MRHDINPIITFNKKFAKIHDRLEKILFWPQVKNVSLDKKDYSAVCELLENYKAGDELVYKDIMITK